MTKMNLWPTQVLQTSDLEGYLQVMFLQESSRIKEGQSWISYFKAVTAMSSRPLNTFSPWMTPCFWVKKRKTRKERSGVLIRHPRWSCSLCVLRHPSLPSLLSGLHLWRHRPQLSWLQECLLFTLQERIIITILFQCLHSLLGETSSCQEDTLILN